VPDNIPQDVIEKADCVIVFPSVLKAAFVVGASYGRGAMVCRTGKDFRGPWGRPSLLLLSFLLRPRHCLLFAFCTSNDLTRIFTSEPRFMMLPSHEPVLAANQFLKKCPVMKHCLPQFFPTGLPLRLTDRDCVGGAVIFQNQRIVHGDIRRTLSKITDWIAARGHHIAQQLIGFR
jgi:hypothetical protein